MIKNIFFYLFIKLILIFSFHAYAETGNLCDKFYDSIRKNNSNLGLYYAPVYEQEYPMFGFQLNQTYDELLGKWIYSRDDNNNISIFNTNYYSNSSEKLKKDDTIISLNKIEVSQLSDEISRISSRTQFNVINVLDGSFTNKSFQIGANADQNVSLSISNVGASSLGIGSSVPFIDFSTNSIAS